MNVPLPLVTPKRIETFNTLPKGDSAVVRVSPLSFGLAEVVAEIASAPSPSMLQVPPLPSELMFAHVLAAPPGLM